MKKKVILIVRNLKGTTLNGQCRKVVSLVSDKTGMAYFTKIKDTQYSEKEGGYIIKGDLDNNLWIFEKEYEIVQTIRLN